MTEFGAAEDIKGDMYALEESMKMADKYTQSWMYWQFKYYQDITTCTPQGESMYNEDGTVCMDKLRILSRTYPMVTAGDLKSFEFHLETARFTMEYQTSSANNNNNAVSDSVAASERDTTTIYVNRDVHYPHGVHVDTSVSSSDSSVSVTCSHTSGLISLKHTGADGDVSVKITACTLKDDISACNCR